MNTLTVKELQEIAKSKGIVLSRVVDGKRKKLNKPELIEAIEAKQAENAQTVETVQTVAANKRTIVTNLIVAQAPTVKPIIVSGENIKLNYKSNADQDLNLNTIVKDSKQLLKLGLVDKVKSHVNILNNKIKSEKKNKLLVNRMSQIRNVLTALLKQSNKKVAAHA